MTEYSELELGIHRQDADSYAIDFRFSLPGSEADVRIGQGQPMLAQFDLEALNLLENDPLAYGKALGQALFSDPQVKSAFDQSVAAANSQDYPIRVRLLIGPSAPELHSLHWETLRDPEQNTNLFTGENILFSRYLSSLDWRPVRLRPKGQLRALVVIANPIDLDQFELASINVVEEMGRIRNSLGDIPITVLSADDKPANLEHIIDVLRNDDFDLLYLVAHGLLMRDEAWLFLENELHKVKRVLGADLTARIKELKQRPRLMVLSSCQSAADKGAGSLSALGPRLAEAGIPAVVAMQGNFSTQTNSEFMPIFFRELQVDGHIDRAMAVARGTVRSRPDYWMPALFMRLKSGRIWYTPGFGEDTKGFEKWPALVRSIKKNQCTPIIGPGLHEDIFGTWRELAQSWAETYHYPMAPHERESLPQVAQYLAVNQDPLFPNDELAEYLKHEIQERFGSQLSPELRGPDASLDAMINAVGTARRKDNPYNPYRVLADLPLPIYITTNLNNLMASALQEAGKDPQVVICPWNEYIEQTETIFDREPNYRPNASRPLVYHLFGRLDDPESVVLTEDAYFDFLIGVTSNKDLIPPVVRAALVNSSLLFLGFQMDEWNFRVLFRTVQALQGGGRRSMYAHIAAQVEPEEGRIIEPGRARRYLENYFAKGAEISLYWGSAEDFARELLPRLNSA